MHTLTYLWERRRTCLRRGEVLLLNLLVLEAPKKKINDRPESLLILSPEKAGDALLTTPLIRLIKQHLPTIRIYVWAWPANADIYLQDPHIAEVFVFRKDYQSLQLLRALRSRRFDMLYNPKDHPSTTFLVLTLLTRAGCKVALRHPLQNRFYHCALRSSSHCHAVEKHHALLDALQIPWRPEDLRPVVYIPSNSQERMEQFLKRGYLKGTLDVLFNLSAGSPQREWNILSWERLGRMLSAGFPGSRIVLLALPRDLPKAQGIQRTIGESALCAPPLPTLLDVAALIDRMDVVVSPDTSVIHLCSALKTPVVGLYTNNERNGRKFAPWFVPHHIVWSRDQRVRSIDSREAYVAVQALCSEVRDHVHVDLMEKRDGVEGSFNRGSGLHRLASGGAASR